MTYSCLDDFEYACQSSINVEASPGSYWYMGTWCIVASNRKSHAYSVSLTKLHVVKITMVLIGSIFYWDETKHIAVGIIMVMNHHILVENPLFLLTILLANRYRVYWFFRLLLLFTRFCRHFFLFLKNSAWSLYLQLSNLDVSNFSHFTHESNFLWYATFCLTLQKRKYNDLKDN